MSDEMDDIQKFALVVGEIMASAFKAACWFDGVAEYEVISMRFEELYRRIQGNRPSSSMVTVGDLRRMYEAFLRESLAIVEAGNEKAFRASQDRYNQPDEGDQ